MSVLCERWGQTPSAILAEDAGLLLGVLSASGEEAEEPVSPEDMMYAKLAARSESLG